MRTATLPGVQVKLRVNGADLHEYADNRDGLYTPKISRQYVEAVSGAEFEICCAVEYGAIVSHTQSDVVACHVFLDGKWAVARVMDPSNLARAHGKAENGTGEYSIIGRVENVGGHYYRRPFGKPMDNVCSAAAVLIKRHCDFLIVEDAPSRFSLTVPNLSRLVPCRYATFDLLTIYVAQTFAELATDESSANDIKPESVASLGELKVQLIWMRRAGAPTIPSGQSDFIPAAGEILPEKCLKGRAISRMATLGEAKACGAHAAQDATYPYGEEPFATFIFKYRSKRDLQIEGVIARTPSPSLLEDRDPGSLTAEEARGLVRRMRAQQDKQVRVKREKRSRSVTHDSDTATVASEKRRRKRARASHDSRIDVIDLTDF